jgi:putative chitinase
MLEHLIAAGVKREKAEQWLEPIRVACAEFEINTEARIAAFLGQCAHETAGFTVLQENLNYSADGMAAIWPSRFAVMGPDKKPVKVNGKNQPNKFALALHRQPEAIANVVYSNRMGNGPIESGEGWKHRGMGLKQLTGKDNQTRCGEALGVDFASNPQLLLEPLNAARSAAWFFKTNNLAKFADAWDIKGMTKKVNGGLIGIADREARCAKVMQCMKTGLA